MSDIKERQAGYYFVKMYKEHDTWIVGSYGLNCWALTGTNEIYFDSDFAQIDERRIEFNHLQAFDLLKEVIEKVNDGYSLPVSLVEDISKLIGVEQEKK